MKPCLFAFLASVIFCCAAAAEADEISARLHTFDLTYTLKLDRADTKQVRRIWDETHFVTTVQGIVNRERPQLYIFLVGGEKAAVDHFWLDRLLEPGGWLAGRALSPLKDIDALVAAYRGSIKGLVVYDEKVPSTSNVASTAAGVENLAAVRYDPLPDSLYTHLTSAPDGPQLPVKLWLINRDGSSLFTGKGLIPGSSSPSSGSAKCDAYLWAKERYLDTGKCDATKLGYYLDSFWIRRPEGYIPNHTLTDHDYLISKRGFLFDLSPWTDENPVDDPGQPAGTDEKTLRAILLSAYKQTGGKAMIHVAGFVPWPWKYTDYTGAGGKHGGVPTEWQYAHILSCFNAFMDADAIGLCAMANSSVYALQPLAKSYPQKRPTLDDLRKRGLILPDGSVAKRSYVAIYGGDYDAASWLYQRLPEIWNDPAHGAIPVGWAFNPNLADRFATGMDWARRNAKGQDAFIAGDSGAGYLNPGSLTPPREFSGLPSGLEAWSAHCKRYYARWDLSVTGFVIDGYAPAMNEVVRAAYAGFSPDGVVAQKTPRISMVGDTPFIRMETDLNDPVSGAHEILAHCKPEKPEFLVCRTILWSPTSLKEMMERVKVSATGPDVEFVDPYTLMLLAKQFMKGPDHGIARALPLPEPKPGEKVNLWSVRYGTKVTGHSDLIPGSDPRDLFGGSYGALESHDLILFADGKPEGTTHWIEWRTTKPITVYGYRLYAHGDEQTGRREIGAFKLYARIAGSTEWKLIDTAAEAGHPYHLEKPDEGLLHSATLVVPVTAMEFRAEFVQSRAPDGTSNGPRIVELEAVATRP